MFDGQDIPIVVFYSGDDDHITTQQSDVFQWFMVILKVWVDKDLSLKDEAFPRYSSLMNIPS